MLCKQDLDQICCADKGLMGAGRAQSYSARYLTHGLASIKWQPSQYSTSISSDRSQRYSPYTLWRIG